MKNTTRSRRSRTAENISAVAEIVEENLGLSILRRSLELGIPQTILHRILHKDLGPVNTRTQAGRSSFEGKVSGPCYLLKR